MTQAQDRMSPRFAYTAAIWALLFAVFSFYYALGGETGLRLQATEIQRRVSDGSLDAALWVTGALKLLACGLALALTRPSSGSRFARTLNAAAAGVGVVLTAYGGIGLVQAVLWQTGVHDVPTNIGRTAAQWKFAFDAFWLLGGILFVASALQFRRTNPQTWEDPASTAQNSSTENR